MQYQNINNIIYLDVREKFELNEGHISGAIHIPLGDILSGNISQISKSDNIHVYCRSGNRSGIATNYLKNMGYNNAVNAGGISKIKGQTIIR